MNGKWVAYYRVSTKRQGASGLGLEGQQASVRAFLAGKGWPPVAEVVEVESGKRSDRPKLKEALALCRLHGATLVIAKLDRLARNAAFCLSLRDAGVRFVAADMPDANEMTIGIMAVVAQGEASMISARTKAALQAAKARGVVLGGARNNTGNIAREAERGRQASAAVRGAKASVRAGDLAPIIRELREGGATTLTAIAAGLNARGIPTARGGSWAPVQVARVLERLGAA